MSSLRLKHIYNTQRWKRLRLFIIARAGYRCEWVEPSTGERCKVRHSQQRPLTVDHTNDDADPYDVRFLKALCRPHHGKKDGGKRIRSRA